MIRPYRKSDLEAYYERDDAWSYRAHRALFEAHSGAKREFTGAVHPAL